MADSKVPYLANDAGVERIIVGAKGIMCMGARAPNDHPHVFLDMGGGTQTLCSYCSTLYVYDDRLESDESDPPGCVVQEAGSNAA